MSEKKYSEYRAEFELFYQSNLGFLYYEAGKYFLQEEDREDCVQSILERLFSIAPRFLQFSHKRKLGYIHRAVRNYAIDFARKKEHFHTQEIEEETAEAQPGQDDMLEKLLLEEERDLVHQCLMKISKIYRDVLVLYYFDDKNSSQIADELGLKQSSVLIYLKRGRAEMKELLLQNGYGKE